MKIFLFILISFFCSKSLLGNSIDLSKDSIKYIGEYSTFIEDKSSKYSIDEVSKLKDSSFSRLKNDVFISFFTDSTYWFKYKVVNNTTSELKRYFVSDTPWIDTINIYIYDNKNRLTMYKIGNTLPFHQRSMKINLLNQVHTFSKGKSTVYIQVKTKDPFILPLSILSEVSFYKKLRKMSFVETATYSIIIAILIFNLLIFIITRFKPYFYYCLYLLSYLTMSLGYDSYTFKYIFYNYPDIQSWMQSIPILLYLLFGLLFAKSFLELKDKQPLINKYTNLFIYVHCFLIIITVLLGYKYTIFYASCITPFVNTYMVFLGVYSYIKGNKNASFYILATLFGCIGAFLTASTALSIIDYNWYLFKGVDIGIVVDSILFSIALAYRYTSLTKEIKNTRDELIKLNHNLEDKVKQRTNKLDIELENKNVLLKELSHRVKNNLQIISALLSMDKNKIKDEYDKELIDINIKRIKSMSILYENFLEIESDSNIYLKQYLFKVVEEFDNSLTSIKLKYEIDVEDDLFFEQTNLIPIGLVLNELLLNSIKYAFSKDKNAKITISFIKSDNKIYFKYKDNGRGTDIRKLKQGFGFSLIDALISHQLNGEVICKNNNGLQYDIILPL
ncbi:7TM diverse intracellular signaling domain-containing protein [Arcobacter sp. CECT 8985]|uniref:7TM diverse intracellular signaling domain-containing protein n=1 Tax=Arcobacter sp. CECT 8985 TaxID=1935424 RepID=UPI00100ACD9C|nr:7TM diverse intracellular signaling domain-containing protein [Arcobacter sp. CECT 8985]RXJ86175.1 histidine kinase [Arcobacter sp. CECT 8985]